jgi:ADP-heptose:LPS heptosyltransferase
MFSAVIEGVKAAHPSIRIHVAAAHPEIFLHNPHVERVRSEGRMKQYNRKALADFPMVKFRSPKERYLQVEGHLIDDLYDRVGIPLLERPRHPRIYLTPREIAYRQQELEALPRPRIAVVCHGKAGIRLPNKLYPLDQWQDLGRLLRAHPATLIQLGSSKEGPLLDGALDYRDIGYRATAAVLLSCELVITHVSGIMHLAAAVETPCVVLYGAAEHPAISGYPWNLNLYNPIECGPCWMEEPCSHHTCMRRLTPEVVMRSVKDALAGAPRLPACHAAIAGHQLHEGS